MRYSGVLILLILTAVIALGCEDTPETPEPTATPEAPEVSDLLELVPRNADIYTFADLDGVRDGGLDDVEDRIEQMIGGSNLDTWGIDYLDVSTVIIADPGTSDSLIIVQGEHHSEDIQHALDDDGFRERPYQNITVWRNNDSGLSIAFPAADVLILGEDDRVRDSIDVLLGDGRSLADDEDVSRIVEALRDADLYSVDTDCDYRGCRTWGTGVRPDGAESEAMFAFSFRDDNSAREAAGDVEDDLVRVTDDLLVVVERELVLASGFVDEESLGIDLRSGLRYSGVRDVLAAVPTAAPARPAPTAMAQARSAPVASAPVATAAPARPAPTAVRARPAPTPARAVSGFDKSSYRGNSGSFQWTGAIPTTFSEAPSLAALVRAGSLPAVEDRLPVASDVFVVAPVDSIGEYGGTWRRAFTGPNDGQNADRIMMDEDLKFDLDGVNIIPNIAKGWEISNDGRTYTLTLRKGMKWSDGAPFTADNYLWWFENVLTNEEINPGRNKQLGWSGYNVETIRKVDETHIQYVLPQKADGFLDQLATYRIGGFTLHGRIGDGDYGPSHYMAQFHRDFASNKSAYDKMVRDNGFRSWPLFFKERSNPLRNTELPVVSPWRVTSPITEQIYEWERNPYYWGVDPAGQQLPYIDNISMILTGDKEVLNLKAIAGEIDFQHRHIDMNKVPVIRENADKCQCSVKFWPSPAGSQAGLTINNSYGLGGTSRSPLWYDVDKEVQKWLFNKDFRIALSHSIDRQRINEVVFLGLGAVSQGGFIKGHPFYPGDSYDQRYMEGRDEANRILDTIGLDKKDGDGFRLRTDGSGETLIFELSYIANYFIDYESIAELTQEDFNRIGIKTYLKAEDVKLYADRRANNDHMLMAGGAGGQRYPLNLSEWYAVGTAYRNWYTGAQDAFAAGNPVAEPRDPNILRLATLTDEAKLLRYGDRKDNYIETQQIVIDNQYVIGFVGGTPAFNGIVVVKDYFKNVPDVAPNQSSLQNPGIARTVQFYMEGGKNDVE